MFNINVYNFFKLIENGEITMIIIGEKINGSIPSVAKAIEARDGEFIKNLAKVQSAAALILLMCAPQFPRLLNMKP
jgi:5-methyltetrahydrofolate--homocysteine methyltransferase